MYIKNSCNSTTKITWLKNKRWLHLIKKKMNRHFTKDDIQMVNKHIKSCSTSLIIREMQTQITYPLGWLIKENTESVAEDVDKLEPLYTADRIVKSCNCYKKRYGIPSGNWKENYHIIQQILFSSEYIPKLKQRLEEIAAQPCFSSIIHKLTGRTNSNIHRWMNG